ncbi:MAG: ABC transporter permease [Chitinispirillaceae bacterium]|nr:ABC transporter permease [Chitinispirillaceae bacterium]
MKIHQLVVKELFQRSSQLWTSVIAVALGIAVMVAVGSITRFSEKAVADALDALGTNILILPKNASVQDYYSADLQQSEMPESYITMLTDSGSLGIDNISAKLSVPIEIRGKKATFTGILPKSEFMATTGGQGALGVLPAMQWTGFPADTAVNPVPKRIIDDLGSDQAVIGSEIGASLKLKKGDFIDVLGKRLRIEAVLSNTGTVDDGRVFARLGTVQQLTGKNALLHSIEITGCNPAALPEVIREINTLLPEARVVTIRHIVGTQQNINAVMRRIAVALLIMMALAGGAAIANFMFANVYERRREIGIFAALGAPAGWIVRLFLIKAAIVGIAGGSLGYIIGTVCAVIFGTKIAGVSVYPVASFIGWSLLIATAVSLVASVIPALRAAVVDPSSIMKEE